VITARLVVAAGIAACAATGHAQSLCHPDEQILFDCAAKAKVISVCASPGWSGSTGRLEYRYGPAGHPEVVLPTVPTPPASSAKAGSLAFSGGGGAYLRFEANGYAYVVYTAIGASWGEKAGVVVERDGKRKASISCSGAERSELGAALFQKAGFLKDDAGFDLP
jgi:hypothetical protein